MEQGGGQAPPPPDLPPAPHPRRQLSPLHPLRFPWFFRCIFVSLLLLFLCIIPGQVGDPMRHPPPFSPGAGPGAPGFAPS